LEVKKEAKHDNSLIVTPASLAPDAKLKFCTVFAFPAVLTSRTSIVAALAART
jgi:hypothetical protein